MLVAVAELDVDATAAAEKGAASVDLRGKSGRGGYPPVAPVFAKDDVGTVTLLGGCLTA